MKTLLVIAALTAADVVADDRFVPIGNRCAGLKAYYLDTTRDIGDGWVRAVISVGPFLGTDDKIGDFFPRLVWDVRCDDWRLADVGRAPNLAEASQLVEATPVGNGKWPSVRCAPDQKFPRVAEMICDYHAKARATK